VTRAVILGAGSGERLRPLWDRPKGLLPFGGETLVQRSLRLLRGAGIGRFALAVGYRADEYRRALRDEPGVELVEVPEFATGGSMASLARVLERVDPPFLLLESDLVYEARALEPLLREPDEDAVLVSGPTHAGDEVWAEADGEGRLRRLSKDPAAAASPAIAGEFVGISRISAGMRAPLLAAAAEIGAAGGPVAYDTDALSAAAAHRRVAVHRIADLLWAEIDGASHLRRATGLLAGALAAREGR